MIDAKIQFSENELNLATDIAFILTKNRIIEKVYGLFGSMSDRYKLLSEDKLPVEVLSAPPKISRGESYNGLPYVMLDYPRMFSRQDVFAIRSMFWWGNDLSITLHLKGNFKRAYAANLSALTGTDDHEWYLQLNDDEWLHHNTGNSHQKLNLLNEIAMNSYIRKMEFIKIACFLPMQQWNNADHFFEHNFSKLIKVFA